MCQKHKQLLAYWRADGVKYACVHLCQTDTAGITFRHYVAGAPIRYKLNKIAGDHTGWKLTLIISEILPLTFDSVTLLCLIASAHITVGVRSHRSNS